MINKIDVKILNACKEDDFLTATMDFLTTCQKSGNCSCHTKDIKDASMCMISHLQYSMSAEDEILSRDIVERYVAWRSAPSNAKKTSLREKASDVKEMHPSFN